VEVTNNYVSLSAQKGKVPRRFSDLAIFDCPEREGYSEAAGNLSVAKGSLI